MNNFETLIVESILIDTQTELNEGILYAVKDFMDEDSISDSEPVQDGLENLRAA